MTGSSPPNRTRRRRSNGDVDAVLAASRALVGVAARSVAALEEEVTLVQYRALLLVADGRVTGPSDLAAALGVHPSNASRLVERMVAKGLLERAGDPDDRRSITLSVGPAGQEVVADVMDRRRADLAAILERLSPEEVEAVTRSLGRFAEAADEPLDDAWRLGWAW